MKKIFLAVFIVLLFGCSSRNHKFLVIDDSAAIRSDFYEANTSNIKTTSECLGAIKELSIRAVDRHLYEFSENTFSFYEKVPGRTPVVKCTWSKIHRNYIEIIKMEYPTSSGTWIYTTCFNCGDAPPVSKYAAIGFPSRSDAELFHAYVLRMIDLHR